MPKPTGVSRASEQCNFVEGRQNKLKTIRVFVFQTCQFHSIGAKIYSGKKHAYHSEAGMVPIRGGNFTWPKVDKSKGQSVHWTRQFHCLGASCTARRIQHSRVCHDPRNNHTWTPVDRAKFHVGFLRFRSGVNSLHTRRPFAKFRSHWVVIVLGLLSLGGKWAFHCVAHGTLSSWWETVRLFGACFTAERQHEPQVCQ